MEDDSIDRGQKMNWDTIIVAAIGFIGSAVASFSGFKLAVYRIDQLEKRVNEHNKLIDRTYNLEKEVALIEQEMREEG